LPACLISDEQRRDDLWCEALNVAAFSDPYEPVRGEPAPLDTSAVRLLLPDGDALLDYTPNNGGRKHVIASAPIELQILDEFGRSAAFVRTETEHECDDIAVRWVVDIEPRDYFFLINERDENIPEVSLFVEDESDLRVTE